MFDIRCCPVLPWVVLQALDLLAYAKRGTARSNLWLIKVIGQLYADKAVAAAVADRTGQHRSSMPDFIFTWHLNRWACCSRQHIMCYVWLFERLLRCVC
jgi:hypothetical protein